MVRFIFSVHLILLSILSTTANDNNDNKFELQNLLRRRFVRATNCPEANMCISRWGFCGTGQDYCGPGCLGGPCGSSATTKKPSVTPCPVPTQCRSKWGYCGVGLAYCGNGCQTGPCGQSTGGVPCPNKNQCRSQWGYCNTGSAYCGVGCQAGPCTTNVAPPSNANNQAGIITSSIFSCIFNTIDSTTVSTNLAALQNTGWTPLNKEEAAAFLAHVFHETDGLKTMVEYCAPSCSSKYTSSWCEIVASKGKTYHGRGWFQLSFPCNYYRAGQALGFDLLNDPDRVANDPVVSIATALWYYTVNKMAEPAQRGDFASTTKILNPIECNNGAGYNSQLTRVATYKRIRTCLGIGNPSINPVC